ncbi:tape measure protein [Corynebacterium glucuronolyticum]|uniref:Tape measure protein n=1 Tax=Corynebacterium glucuronolyticum TaxID=39791 RepID=A0A7T4BN35_9CORY|nr:tape measure protein [Corynebacterium glucuronolyticum]QQB45301.1 tape measure protein [Corynebacterium glucuronolyticum]
MSGVHSAIEGGMARLQNVEQAQKMLEGLGHSAGTIDTIMDNAMQSVKGTAFGFGEAASMAATFVGAGVKEGDDLQRVLSLVGDSAAIAGADFQEMGSIWTKIASNQKLSTEELNQLMDRGLGILPKLQEKYGVTAEEARKMISEGKVGFEDFADVMEDMVGGSAQSMGETFSGSAANARAALSRLGEKLQEPLFQAAPAIFAAIGQAIDDLGLCCSRLLRSWPSGWPPSWMLWPRM